MDPDALSKVHSTTKSDIDEIYEKFNGEFA